MQIDPAKQQKSCRAFFFREINPNSAKREYFLEQSREAAVIDRSQDRYMAALQLTKNVLNYMLTKGYYSMAPNGNLHYLCAGIMKNPRKQRLDSPPSTTTATHEEPRNALGYTWPAYEEHVRTQLTSENLSDQEVELRIKLHKTMFERQTGRHPAAEERQRLLDAAVEATSPELLPSFLEAAKKSWA